MGEIVGEALTKENYEYWFECVKNYLIAQDVWEVVDGTFAKPREEDDKKEFLNWRKKNAAALHIILISCGTHAFSNISKVSEAKDAWNFLSHTYNYNLPPEPKPVSEPPLQVTGEEVNYDVSALYKAICKDKWNSAKAFLEEHPSAWCAKITTYGETALHVAAALGDVSMLEKLVGLVPSPKYLEIVDDQGFTPLATAAAYKGDPRVAQCLLNKNTNVLAISTPIGSLPVSIAIFNGHIKMARYLYSLTPLEVLKPKNAIPDPGVRLLYWCFNFGELGIAVDLLQKCPELILAKDEDGQISILKIASMTSAYSNGNELVFWKRWIYNYMKVQSNMGNNSVHLNIQQQGESEIVKGGSVSRFISKAYNMLGMKEIYEMKLMHTQAAQILSLLCENISFFGSNMIEERDKVLDALFDATEEGNVEFVVKISKANPQLIQLKAKKQRTIFFRAVKYRQAKIFILIHGLSFKNKIASQTDEYGNSLLHVVAKLAPSSKLNRISGPAFQMQSELQWFKEVESVVPEAHKVFQNGKGMRPQDVFKENHKDLRNEGEKWMKDTASSCSVVAALVVTIMFAAAFTVPGGNNQDFGYPIFLEKKLFTLFVISDALSLFSSTTSVLMFLGIFTSRYAEEDFLKSLPTKLIIGLSTLFLSIATMMIAFSATILLMLQHRSHSWVYLPLIILASVPVTLFVLLQFPLLVRMVYSTYGPGIFKRNAEPWL